MLVNLSNFPHRAWPFETHKAVQDIYGHIVDLPSPQLDPSADALAVHNLAREYVIRALVLFNHNRACKLMVNAIGNTQDAIYVNLEANLFLPFMVQWIQFFDSYPVERPSIITTLPPENNKEITI